MAYRVESDHPPALELKIKKIVKNFIFRIFIKTKFKMNPRAVLRACRSTKSGNFVFKIFGSMRFV